MNPQALFRRVSFGPGRRLFATACGRLASSMHGNAAIRCPLLLTRVGVVVLLFATQGATAQPSWWTSRNVIDSSATETNDYAAANLGQLKWFATNACDELENESRVGAGTSLWSLVSGFSSSSNNYAAINVGQLKTVAALVYDRLIAEGYTNAYPWTASTADDTDYAAANLGQLKNVFSFDIARDDDSDGMPDWWEIQHFGSTNAAASADDDGDGFLNVYEYVHQADPTNSASIPEQTASHIYVSTNGTHATPFSNWTTAATNIQAALDIATNGYDIVWVADGVYSGDGNTNLGYGGSTIMLTSTNGADDCVVDGGGTARGFYFRDSEDREAVLHGMTVRNGNASWAGAIRCHGAGPTIQSCVIVSNTTTGWGGAIGLSNSTALVRDCVVRNNSSTAAEVGGISCFESTPIIENCLLQDNEGVYAGAVSLLLSEAQIRNCTIVDNDSTYYAAVLVWGGSTGILDNCILWGNTPDQLDLGAQSQLTVNYCCVQDGYSGTGNITADPQLRMDGRLCPSSPCIDSGSDEGSTRDVDGESRWDDPAHTNVVGITDIGWDERVDEDRDGMADDWEREWFGSISASPYGDADGDYLNNLNEYTLEWDPTDSDSDDDGIEDGLDWFTACFPGDVDIMTTTPVTFSFGDTNGTSGSEIYCLTVATENVSFAVTNAAYGTETVVSTNYTRLCTYTQALLHIATDPAWPKGRDYDYHFFIDGESDSRGWTWMPYYVICDTNVTYDEKDDTDAVPTNGVDVGQGILGNHWENEKTHWLDATNGSGDVVVYVPLVDLDGDVDRNGVTNTGDAILEGVAPGAFIGVSNDLYHLRFTRGPESMPTGTVTLAIVSGTDRIRVWTSPAKGAGDLLLSSSNATTNWVLTAPSSWSTIPEDLWIEGMTNSTTIADTALAARFTGPSGTLCADTNLFTIIKVDLDIDSDYDGDIQDDDDSIETSEGGAVGINTDDDDGDDAVDRDETGSISGEDDLEKITLSVEPSLSTGTVRLETVYSGVGRIAIWEGADKTTSVSLTKTWDLSTDTVPPSLWIEGISPSTNGARDVEMHLSYENGGFACTDTVAVTVCELIFSAKAKGETPSTENALTTYLLGPAGAIQNGDTFTDINGSGSSFIITRVSNQADVIAALHTEDAYVAIGGHANYGLGITFGPCSSISDCLNMGSANAGVSYSGLRSSAHFGSGFTIAPSDIDSSVQNYSTTVGSMERFRNVAYNGFGSSWPDLDYVAVGDWFPSAYYQSGYNIMHYYEWTSTSSARLLVHAGSADLPTLKYRKLLLKTCQSKLHFADQFQHGTVFFSNWNVFVVAKSRKVFVQGVIEGKSNAQIKAALDSSGALPGTWGFQVF